MGDAGEHSLSEIGFERTFPIVRIFDEAKAREFYVGWLGCSIDWEHRFHAGAPLYCQVSRGNLKLHLSEHSGDATPGSTALCYMTGVEALLREYAEPAPAAPFAHPPFRRVLLAGAEGWAFSKPFRMELANSGLEVRLRPMPDPHDA